MNAYKKEVLKGVQKACIDCMAKAFMKGERTEIVFLEKYIKDITLTAEGDYVTFYYLNSRKEYTFGYVSVNFKERFETTSTSPSDAIDRLLKYVIRWEF